MRSSSSPRSGRADLLAVQRQRASRTPTVSGGFTRSPSQPLRGATDGATAGCVRRKFWRLLRPWRHPHRGSASPARVRGCGLLSGRSPVRVRPGRPSSPRSSPTRRPRNACNRRAPGNRIAQAGRVAPHTGHPGADGPPGGPPAASPATPCPSAVTSPPTQAMGAATGTAVAPRFGPGPWGAVRPPRAVAAATVPAQDRASDDDLPWTPVAIVELPGASASARVLCSARRAIVRATTGWQREGRFPLPVHATAPGRERLGRAAGGRRARPWREADRAWLGAARCVSACTSPSLLRLVP